MKRERGFSGALAVCALAAGAVFGSATQGSAALLPELQSYTQPSAELVMPFDATASKATFLLVSNVGPVQSALAPNKVSTHWTFWSETCNELVNFSICLTLNDTVVVDPRNLQAIDENNNGIGPKANLDGKRGVVTVVAYETDSACSPFGRSSEIGIGETLLIDDVLVGSFTIADTSVGFSFGNDALGLGLNTDDVPYVELPPGNEIANLDILTANPASPDFNSWVFLSRLHQTRSANEPVVPAGTSTFFVEYFDNQEVRTSLPDTSVGCAVFRTAQPDLIPANIDVQSAGIIRLTPRPGTLSSNDFVYGVHGMSVGQFGASASVKTVLSEGSASRAFLDSSAGLVD